MCKSILLGLAFVSLSFLAYSQENTAPTPEDSIWLFGGTSQINFSQATFINWAAGGENTIAATGQLDLFLINNGDNYVWRNDLRLAYGKIKSGAQIRKSDDIIQWISSYCRSLSKTLSFSTKLDFRTQFDRGFNYPDDSTVISSFMAPGFLVVSSGFQYAPKKYLSLYLSPVAGKFTYVRPGSGIAAENYGVEQGRQLRAELGATFRMSVDKKLMENVQLVSDLELFSNYLKEPQNIDINWLVKLNLKVNKYIAAAITTQLIYDHDILLTKTNSQGETYKAPGTQFREVLNVGLTYNF